MQRYDFYLIPPNFYTLFCYLEITFYTVDAHTGRNLTIQNPIGRNVTNLKVHFSRFRTVLRCLLPPADAPETASRRSDGYVATYERLRRDAASTTSGRIFKGKRAFKGKKVKG